MKIKYALLFVHNVLAQINNQNDYIDIY